MEPVNQLLRWVQSKDSVNEVDVATKPGNGVEAMQ